MGVIGDFTLRKGMPLVKGAWQVSELSGDVVAATVRQSQTELSVGDTVMVQCKGRLFNTSEIERAHDVVATERDFTRAVLVGGLKAASVVAGPHGALALSVFPDRPVSVILCAPSPKRFDFDTQPEPDGLVFMQSALRA